MTSHTASIAPETTAGAILNAKLKKTLKPLQVQRRQKVLKPDRNTTLQSAHDHLQKYSKTQVVF